MMRSMRVAICGRMASGKSRLADELVGNHGFERVSLARAVKLMGQRVIETMVEDGLLPADVLGTKQRRLLQTIGAVGREIDPRLWIRDTLTQTEAHERVVIDDVRFPNEAEALVEAGFILIRLGFDDEQMQIERLRRAYPDTWERHWAARDDVSESGIDGIPAELVDLELTVRDGDDNLRDLLDHLWLS